jgi:hypothetical protein
MPQSKLCTLRNRTCTFRSFRSFAAAPLCVASGIAIPSQPLCLHGSAGLAPPHRAISQLAGRRYWSTTHQHWQTLIVSADALARSRTTGRQDFTPDELQAGKVLYLQEADNLSGTAIYRMHIAEASADRIVFDTVTLFRPGEMQSIYFLDRESAGVWRYYCIARTGRNASRLAAGHESSSINRAVAFYRALAGIPSDQEPPGAR